MIRVVLLFLQSNISMIEFDLYESFSKKTLNVLETTVLSQTKFSDTEISACAAQTEIFKKGPSIDKLDTKFNS